MPALGLGLSPVMASKLAGADWASNILSLFPEAYWRFNQSAGVSITDYSGNGYEAQATGLTWVENANPEGNDYCAFFDGLNDVANMELTGAGAANGIDGLDVSAAGTLMVWCKVASSLVWSDSTVRPVCRFRTTDGRVDLQKQSDSNSFRMLTASITPTTVDTNSFSPSGWFPIVVTWSSANNRYRYWLNNLTVNEQAYAADPFTSINLFLIGSYTGSYWHGYVADVALWLTELPAATVESTLLARS